MDNIYNIYTMPKFLTNNKKSSLIRHNYNHGDDLNLIQTSNINNDNKLHFSEYTFKTW